jgi:hypothetical protein
MTLDVVLEFHISLQHLVAEHAIAAQQVCPSLADKHVSPRALRHTTAMGLLQARVDHTLIALWLGHESVETTQIYLDADLAIKERVLSKTTPINAKPGRFRPDDDLLAFLKGPDPCGLFRLNSSRCNSNSTPNTYSSKFFKSIRRSPGFGIALGSAAPPVGNWSRFNFSSATFRSRPQKATLVALSGFRRR